MSRSISTSWPRRRPERADRSGPAVRRGAAGVAAAGVRRAVGADS
ncbi:hypothetical protein Ae168Ps1_1685c [Pseudonocardia sp. Ae168_Ps1]|nr:hypothetical protein Ae150APs1_1678c [Pseudonocardia sp. Ae150A_Ps1]OLL79279.1 hypothetical protein Ae168Ps1_1685c [Pseudonocardia sp. Ae168_Ps1]OLL86583.1 hypothetical protein Ae263Ps1_3638 [Pseudonocardia sp. Ae263_Ps1]OLL93369.1 hypothetical protein Ae356Ps1_3266c [Pseudonocardia sp. Ae356_Ps1]